MAATAPSAYNVGNLKMTDIYKGIYSVIITYSMPMTENSSQLILFETAVAATRELIFIFLDSPIVVR